MPRPVAPYENQYKFLTVLSIVGMGAGKHALAECRCICGMVKWIRVSHLRAGRIRSCKCKKFEMAQECWRKAADSRAEKIPQEQINEWLADECAKALRLREISRKLS